MPSGRTVLIICLHLRTEPQVEAELSDYTELCAAQLTAREHGLLSERAHGVVVLYGYTTFITLGFSFLTGPQLRIQTLICAWLELTPRL